MMISQAIANAANAASVTVDFGSRMAPVADDYAPCIQQKYLYARSIAYKLDRPSHMHGYKTPDAVMRNMCKHFTRFTAALDSMAAELELELTNKQRDALQLDQGGIPSVVCSLSQEQRAELKRALCDDVAQLAATALAKAAAPKLFDGEPLPHDVEECERELEARCVEVRAQIKLLDARAARLRAAKKTMQRLANNRKIAAQATSGDDALLFTSSNEAAVAACSSSNKRAKK